MRYREFIGEVEKILPLEDQEVWDNSGFQLGNREAEIRGAVLALDLSQEAIDFCLEKDCDLIYTHHPVFFSGKKSFNLGKKEDSLIFQCLEKGIQVYSSHTNLDKAKGGVNDALAEKLGLRDTKVLADDGFGRYGTIEKSYGLDFLKSLKEKLGANGLVYYGDPSSEIRKVGVMGGAGSDYIERALYLSLDAYVTADIKYHQGELANNNGLLLVDAGHYETEVLVLDKLKDFVTSFFLGRIYCFYREGSKKRFI